MQCGALPAEAEVVLKAIDFVASRNASTPLPLHESRAIYALAKAPDMTTVRRQAMIGAAILALAACAGAWAIYVWMPRTSPTGQVELDLLPPTGEVKFEYSLVEKTVRAQLHDPNSAKFGPMLAYRFNHLNGKSGTAVCGSVSAKNRAGEYDDPKDFVFISNPVSAVVDPSLPDARFLNVWKEYCTKR